LNVSSLVAQKHQYDDTTRQPNGQAGHVDQSECFVTQQISKRDFEVVFEHSFAPVFSIQ
jgi:hypothetical protein